jgi:hypothetical protein
VIATPDIARIGREKRTIWPLLRPTEPTVRLHVRVLVCILLRIFRETTARHERADCTLQVFALSRSAICVAATHVREDGLERGSAALADMQHHEHVHVHPSDYRHTLHLLQGRMNHSKCASRAAPPGIDC